MAVGVSTAVLTWNKWESSFLMSSFQRKSGQKSKDYKLDAVHFVPSAEDIKKPESQLMEMVGFGA